MTENTARNGKKRAEPPTDTVPGPNRVDAGRLERLREAVSRSGGSTSVAARAGVPLSTLNGYLAGGEMKFSNAAELARVCGVTLDWLAGSGDTSYPRLFATIDTDQLAAARAYTDEAFRTSGKSPDPREYAQALVLIYDMLSAQKFGRSLAKK